MTTNQHLGKAGLRFDGADRTFRLKQALTCAVR